MPIVAFYILKVRLRRYPVSTNLFWRQIYDEKPPRSIWQNFRHLMSLLAQLAILFLLVLAIADPFLPWNAERARRMVLVIDPSASMQARDVAPTRFDAAKAHATTLLSGLRDQDQVAIVLAGKSPEVVVGMTGHVPTLRRAIEAIQVTDRATHLTDSINLGRKLIGDHPQGQVIVLTDGCDQFQAASAEMVEDPTGATPAGDQLPASEVLPTQATGKQDKSEIAVHWEIFATEANNVGITQFQARRSLGDPLGYEILTSVLNASSEAISARLEITLNEVPVDVLPLKIEPGEQWRRSLEKTSMEGGQLMATLSKIEPQAKTEEKTEPDSVAFNQLQVDDFAWAYLPPRKKQPVLLVTEGNFFLQKVFEVNPLVELQVLKELPETWPVDTLIVLHRMIPEVLPQGNLLVIDPEGDSELWQDKGALPSPIITQQDEASPLMAHLRLDNVLVPEARKLTFSAPITTLAGTVSGDPIYAEVKRAAGRCLLLCVNLEQSDLAFRTVFPIMVSNALNWYAGEGGALNRAIVTDQLISVKLEPPVAPWETVLISPTDVQTTLISGAESAATESSPGEETTADDLDSAREWTVGPFATSGMWQIARVDKSDAKGDEEIVRYIAVNISNERETDLRPSEDRLSDERPRSWIGGSWNRPVWFYLAIVICLFSAAEWGLYQRRVIT